MAAGPRRRGLEPETFARCASGTPPRPPRLGPRLSWPQDYAAAERPYRGARVREETIHARAPVPLNVDRDVNNIAPDDQQYGTDAKSASSPRMVRADDLWCQGLSSREAG